MGLKHRDDSIVGIRLREAQKTKIATSAELLNGSIVLELPEGGVCTGTMVKFSAPCSCDKVTGGIKINEDTYTVVDAMGECVTGVGGVWDAGAQIAVLIDHENGTACIQNAATKGIMDELNAHIRNKNNPHEVKAPQVEVGEAVETALRLDDGASVAAAFLAMHNEMCSIASGAYVGHLETNDAKTGVEIEFPFKPKMAICMPSTTTYAVAGWIYTGGSSAMPFATGGALTDMFVSLTFDGNTATLGPAANSDRFWTVSRKGVTYRWVAFA